MREAMGGISWSEDGAVESVRSESFVEVGGPHGILHVPHGEHALGSFSRGLEAGPHREVFFGVDLLVFSPVYSVEVLCDGLVHLVTVTDELVLHDD